MVRLYVGGIPEAKVTEKELLKLFKSFGSISKCTIVKNFGFIDIDTESGGIRAIQELDGYTLKGSIIKVQRVRIDKPAAFKIFIVNFSPHTRNKDLRELFEPYCTVLEADIMTDKGYGFVHVDAGLGKDRVDQIIRNLNGVELNGRRIKIVSSTFVPGSEPEPKQALTERRRSEGRMEKEDLIKDNHMNLDSLAFLAFLELIKTNKLISTETLANQLSDVVSFAVSESKIIELANKYKHLFKPSHQSITFKQPTLETLGFLFKICHNVLPPKVRFKFFDIKMKFQIERCEDCLYVANLRGVLTREKSMVYITFHIRNAYSSLEYVNPEIGFRSKDPVLVKVKISFGNARLRMEIESVSKVDGGLDQTSEPAPGSALPAVNSQPYSWSKHKHVIVEDSENEIFFSDDEELQEEDQIKFEEEDQIKFEDEEHIRVEDEDQMRVEDEDQIKFEDQIWVEDEEQIRVQDEEQIRVDDEEQIRVPDEEQTRVEDNDKIRVKDGDHIRVENEDQIRVEDELNVNKELPGENSDKSSELNALIRLMCERADQEDMCLPTKSNPMFDPKPEPKSDAEPAKPHSLKGAAASEPYLKHVPTPFPRLEASAETGTEPAPVYVPPFELPSSSSESVELSNPFEPAYSCTRAEDQDNRIPFLIIHLFLSNESESQYGVGSLEIRNFLNSVEINKYLDHHLDFSEIDQVLMSQLGLFKNMGCNQYSRLGKIKLQTTGFLHNLICLGKNVWYNNGRKSLNDAFTAQSIKNSIIVTDIVGFLSPTHLNFVYYATIPTRFGSSVIAFTADNIPKSSSMVHLKLRVVINSKQEVITTVMTVGEKKTKEAAGHVPIFSQIQELENRVRAEKRKANQANKRNLKTKSNPSPVPITEPPSPEIVTNPTPETTTKPSPESVTKPSPDSVTKPSPESVTKPSPDSVTKPSPETVTKPSPEIVTNSSPVIVTNSSPEIVTNSSPETATKPSPESATELPLGILTNYSPETVTIPSQKIVINSSLETVTKPSTEIATTPTPESTTKPSPETGTELSPKLEASLDIVANTSQEFKHSSGTQTKALPAHLTKPILGTLTKHCLEKVNKPPAGSVIEPSPESSVKPSPDTKTKPFPEPSLEPSSNTPAKPSPKSMTKALPNISTKPFPEPIAKLSSQKANKTAAEPSAEPFRNNATKPSPERIAKPSSEKGNKTPAEPPTKPSQDIATKPSPEPLAKPSSDTTIKSSPEPFIVETSPNTATKPFPESIAKLSLEKAKKPTAESQAKPSSETATKTSPEPSPEQLIDRSSTNQEQLQVSVSTPVVPSESGNRSAQQEPSSSIQPLLRMRTETGAVSEISSILLQVQQWRVVQGDGSGTQEIEITGRIKVEAGERILAISDLVGSAQFVKTT